MARIKGPRKTIFAFIDAAQYRFGVKALCARYGVTRAGYYAWRRRKQSPHDREARDIIQASILSRSITAFT